MPGHDRAPIPPHRRGVRSLMPTPAHTPPLALLKRHARAAVSSVGSYRRKLAIGGHGLLRPAETQPAIAPPGSTPSALGPSAPEPLAHWLGHATVLLNLAGFWVLTDPVLALRIGVELGPRIIGVRRLTPVALPPAGFPPIDVILISHAHFDHLDRPTLRHLASPITTVVTARHTTDLIPRGFASVHEVGWRERWRLDRAGASLEIEALRPEHWGARHAIDRRRGFNSYVLTATRPGHEPQRVLFAGDTGATDAFEEVGGLDLAILGIGSYEPWEHMHATPEQAWAMFQRMRALRLMPVHHSTFPLGHEPITDPLRRLLLVAGPKASAIVGTGGPSVGHGP
jgi:L-ascorbate metabolism protein UlaG (beta-lactamase superfamily)